MVCKTVLVMVTAVQPLGLVMALLTVKIRHMAVTLPAMIMMVATVMAEVLTVLNHSGLINIMLRS